MKYKLSSLFLPLALGCSKQPSEQYFNKSLSVSVLEKEPLSDLEKKMQILALLEEQEAFRAMSFNILLQNDEIDSACPFTWEKRKEQIASMIRFHKADVIGLQEPFVGQLKELMKILPDFDCYGVGWEDGEKEGLIDPILLRKNRFFRKNQGHFFLSPTPDTPSKGWDSKFPRGVTWVEVKDKKTGKEYFIFNTHFDYHSEKARNESAILLRKKIPEIAGKAPFIVTGDFNLFPEMGGEGTYELLIAKNQPNHCLVDAKAKAIFPHHGPTGTWSGFKEAGQPGIKPDFIFVSDKIHVISHGVLSDSFDGSFPSDHLPVVADLFLGR